jgi:SAM-dependent methyltransferase
MPDARLYAPATQRNRNYILEVLRPVLRPSGTVLEIASGSGEHIIHFAQALPGLTFQPTDPTQEALASIAAWIDEAKAANIRPPIRLDVTEHPWPVTAADAVLCINMIHIAPWSATVGLMRGAAKILQPGAPLYLYGPYRRDGAHTAPSNADFDANLKARDPAWGVRDLEAVTQEARAAGFSGPAITQMPANNLSVVFRRESAR